MRDALVLQSCDDIVREVRVEQMLGEQRAVRGEHDRPVAGDVRAGEVEAAHEGGHGRPQLARREDDGDACRTERAHCISPSGWEDAVMVEERAVDVGRDEADHGGRIGAHDYAQPPEVRTNEPALRQGSGKARRG